MVKKTLKVIWDDEAKLQLKSAFEYIRNDSLQNAQKVRKDIIEAARSLSQDPEKYNPDKYKMVNDGTYRAFEIHHFRISYRIISENIKILRVRGTKQRPQQY